MTGHAHRTQSQRSGLDKLTRQLQADRKGRNPHVVALEEVEQKMLRTFLREFPADADVHDAGSALLVFGQLAADLVTKLDGVGQQQAGPLFINLARLVGEALYSGRLPLSHRCEYDLAGGLPCHYLAEAGDQEKLDILLRAHMGLHHPDIPWPPKPEPVEPESAPSGALELAEGSPFHPPTLGAGLRRPGARVEPAFNPDGTLREISITRPDGQQ